MAAAGPQILFLNDERSHLGAELHAPHYQLGN